MRFKQSAIKNQQSTILHFKCPHCRQSIALQLVEGDASPPAADLTARLVGLPIRQCQVLSLLCEGLTIKQMAGRLGLHPRTVGLHIRGLKERFGAENIAQLVRLCSLAE
jgi:DNA-binding NarL/FixJ family response regulator